MRSRNFFANMYYAIVRKFIDKNMPVGGCDCYLIDRQVIQVLELLDEKNSSLTLQGALGRVSDRQSIFPPQRQGGRQIKMDTRQEDQACD